MFLLILCVGFLCFSVGESSTYGAPTTADLTADTTTSGNRIMTSAQPPAPSSVIIGLRVGVQSVVDLTRNSPEMDLLVRQVQSFIPSQYRPTTSITVRRIQRGSGMS